MCCSRAAGLWAGQVRSVVGMGSNQSSCEAADVTAEELMDEKNLYKLLGTTNKASSDEIKSAYRKRALRFHPDRAKEEVKKLHEEVFKRLNAAHFILGDPQRRADYDRWGPSSFCHQTMSMFSHAVERHELKVGDHVYYYITRGCGTQHHGIVSYVGAGVDDVKIIDFGFTDRVREVPLHEFLPTGTVRRAKYREHSTAAMLKFVASYPDAPDDPVVVLRRARQLLLLEQMEYHLLEQNCETVAFWCKTGKRYSGQASKFEGVLKSIAGTLVVASGVCAIVAVATTGFLVESAVVVGGAQATAAATSTMVLGGWAIGTIATGAVGAGVALILGSVIAWRYRRRQKIRAAPGLNVINLITTLHSRGRREDACNDTFEIPVVQDLANVLDGLLACPTAHVDNFTDSVCSHTNQHFTNVFGKHGTDDDKKRFLVQVLARCETFDAILNLPAHDEFTLSTSAFLDPEKKRHIMALLRSAQVHLLRIRESKIQEFTLSDQNSVHRVSAEQRLELLPKAKGTFTLTVHVEIKVGGGPRQQHRLTSNKRKADFVRLYDVLCELHPGVVDATKECKPGTWWTTKSDVDVLSRFLLAIIALAETDVHLDPDRPTQTEYLKSLQHAELNEQLRFFIQQQAAPLAAV